MHKKHERTTSRHTWLTDENVIKRDRVMEPVKRSDWGSSGCQDAGKEGSRNNPAALVTAHMSKTPACPGRFYKKQNQTCAWERGQLRPHFPVRLSLWTIKGKSLLPFCAVTSLADSLRQPLGVGFSPVKVTHNWTKNSASDTRKHGS